MPIPTGATHYITCTIQSSQVDTTLSDWMTLICVCDMVESINTDAQSFVAGLESDLSDLEITDSDDNPIYWRRILFDQTIGSEKLYCMVNLAIISQISNTEIKLFRGCTSPVGEDDGSSVVSANTQSYLPLNENDISFDDWVAGRSNASRQDHARTTDGLIGTAQEFVKSEQNIITTSHVALSTGITMACLGMQTSGNTSGDNIAGIFASGGYIRFLLYNGDQLRWSYGPAISEQDYVSSGSQMVQNEWTTLAGVWDGTEMHYYQNDLHVSKIPSDVETSYPAAMWLGGHGWDANLRWEGKLQHLIVTYDNWGQEEFDAWKTMFESPDAWSISSEETSFVDLNYNSDIDIAQLKDYNSDSILQIQNDINYNSDSILKIQNDINYNSDAIYISSYSGRTIIAAGNGKILIGDSPYTVKTISSTITEVYNIYQLNNFTILACTDDGLWKSENDGDDWNKISLHRIWGDISGYIKDEDGNSIQNAKVYCIGTPLNFNLYTYTDVSGYFKFDNLDPKKYTIIIDKTSNYDLKIIKNIYLGVSEDKVLHIQLEKPSKNSYLLGIVSDISGDAVANVNVKIISANNSESVLSSENGVFVFNNLNNGYYELEFSKNGYFDEEKREIFISENIKIINLALKKLTGKGEIVNIIGSVIDSATGDYIYDAKVSLSNLTNSAVKFDNYYTNVLGEFNVNNLPQGKYKIEIEKNDYNKYDQVLDITTDEDITLDVELDTFNVGGIIGYVVDISSQTVISDVDISISNPQIAASDTISDSDGYYYFNDIKRAKYTLTASIEGYYDAQFEVYITENKTSQFTIYMLSENISDYKSITCRVYSQAGNPINNANVYINTEKFVYTIVTNENGIAILNYLPYDNYYISVSKDGYKADSAKITVNNNQEDITHNFYIEEIILNNKATILGHISEYEDPIMYTFPAELVNVDGDRKTKRLNLRPPRISDLSRVKIYLSGYGRIQSDDRGYFILSNINPGTYQLVAEKGGYYNSFIKWIEVSANETLNLHNIVLSSEDEDISNLQGTVYNVTEFYETIPHATIFDKDTEELRFCDGEGNYEWKNARGNRISLTAIKNGYIPNSFSRQNVVIDDKVENVFSSIDSDSSSEFEIDFEIREADEDTIIWGFVRDDRTGNPIENASVTIGDFSTTTNSEGFYIIKEYYGSPTIKKSSLDLLIYEKPSVEITHSEYFTKNNDFLFPDWPIISVPSKTATIEDLSFDLARKSLYPYYVKIKGTVRGETGYESGIYTPLANAQVTLSSTEGEGDIDPELGGYLIERQLTPNTQSPNFEFYLVFAEPPSGSVYNIFASHYSNFWFNGSESVTVTPSNNPTFEQFQEIEITIDLRRPEDPIGEGTLIEQYSSNPLSQGKSFVWGHIIESATQTSMAQNKLDKFDSPQDNIPPRWSYGNNYSISTLNSYELDLVNKIRNGYTIANKNYNSDIVLVKNSREYSSDIKLLGKKDNLSIKLYVNPILGAKNVDSDNSEELSFKIYVNNEDAEVSFVSSVYEENTLPANTTTVNKHQRTVGHSFYGRIGIADDDYEANSFIISISGSKPGNIFINWVRSKINSGFDEINATDFFNDYPAYLTEYGTINNVLDTFDSHNRSFNLGYQNTFGPFNFNLTYPNEFFLESIEDPDPNTDPDYPGAETYVNDLELDLPDYSETGYWGQFSEINGSIKDNSENYINDASVLLRDGLREEYTLSNDGKYDSYNYAYDAVWSNRDYQLLSYRENYKPKLFLITQIFGESPEVGALASGDLLINGDDIGVINPATDDTSVDQGRNLANSINAYVSNVYADYDDSDGALYIYSTASDNNLVISGNDLTYTGLTAGTYYPNRNISLIENETLSSDKKQNITKYSFDINMVDINENEAGIFGYIFDVNENPINGANIDMGAYSATTNSDGFYQLNAAKGSYSNIVISKSGYHTQTLNGINMDSNKYYRRNVVLLADTEDYGTLRIESEANVEVICSGNIVIDDITDNSGVTLISALKSGTYNILVSKNGKYEVNKIQATISDGEITTKNISLNSYSDHKIQISGVILKQINSSSKYNPNEDNKLIGYDESIFAKNVLRLEEADVEYSGNSFITDNYGDFDIELSNINDIIISASKETDNYYGKSVELVNFEYGKHYDVGFILINDIGQIKVFTVIETTKKLNEWNIILGTNYGVLGASLKE